MVRVNREAEGGGGTEGGREGIVGVEKNELREGGGKEGERESREVRGVHCCKGRRREKVREI